MDVPQFPAPPALEGTVRQSEAHERVSDDAFGVASRRIAGSASNRDAVVRTRATGFVGKRARPHRNSVHPKSVIHAAKKQSRCRRVTEFCLKMTERRGNEDDEDDDDVVCAAGTPTTIADELATRLKNGTSLPKTTYRTEGTQTIVGQVLRLRVLPSTKDVVSENDVPETVDGKKTSRFWRHLRFLGRLALCQFGLAWLLSIWAMAGAAAFCATEGPREREQVIELKDMQRDLAVGLAMELRQLRIDEDQDVEPLWSNKVRQYVARHEKLLLVAVSSGYGEGGNDGQLWTFPGCVLFAISLLTTLGFGAPVPRTTAGRTVAVVFAAIGIPAHFLLVMNIGILLAVWLQKYAVARRKDRSEPNHPTPLPNWVKIVPFVCISGYYVIGILGFGVARSRPLAASVLFPLDFTAAGGLATTLGHVRILYALYLEGAVMIAAIAVAVLRVSATQSLTNIGLKYGLLIEA